MNHYKRLSLNEREEISRLLASEWTPGAIAKKLGRYRSTIVREIAGGGCNKYTYRAVKADRRARRKAVKRKLGRRKYRINIKLKRYIVAKIRLYWSPEQIAQTLKTEYSTEKDMQISPEAIYAALYVLPKGTLKKELLSKLRRQHKRRHRRQKGIKPITERRIENMILIDERPQEILARSVPGHWEGDLLIGKNRQSQLGSLAERMTRKAILVPLKSREAEHVRAEFAKAFNRIPEHTRLTLTYDQGREMADHEALTKRVNVKVYFAHKASPWERGTNENTNGLIRQFFPKGTDFSKISRREVKQVETLLNGRPRKVLNWKTPDEVFNQLLR
jgi:IS30 family transposase